MNPEEVLIKENNFRFRKIIQYSFIVCILLIQLVIAGYFYNEFSNKKSLNLIQKQLDEVRTLDGLTSKAKAQLSDAQNNLQQYFNTNDKTYLEAYFSSLNVLDSKINDIQSYNAAHPQFKLKNNGLLKLDNSKNLKKFIDSTKEITSKSVEKESPFLPSLNNYTPKYNFNNLEVETKTFSDSIKKKGLLGRLKDAVSGDVKVKKDSTVVIIKLGNKPIDLQSELDGVLKTVTNHYTKEVKKIRIKAIENQNKEKSNLKSNQKVLFAFGELFQYSNNLINHYDIVTNNAKTNLDKEYAKLSSKSNKIRDYLVFSLMGLMFVVSLLIFYFTRIAFIYETKLKEANVRINENLKFKSRILGMLSHEIRSPLKIIGIFINRIQKKTEDDTIKEYLKSISFTNNSLLLQANQILEYTKNQQAVKQLTEANFNLKNEISSILTAIQPYIESRNNQLKIDENIPENLMVNSDNAKIHQVYMNILANANKFTENGVVSVHTFVEEIVSKEIVLKTSIADTGVGMSENDLKNIFEPYYQGVLCDEVENLGAGLGLSLCKEIIELFKGEISVSSQKNKGTKVSFSFIMAKAN